MSFYARSIYLGTWHGASFPTSLGAAASNSQGSKGYAIQQLAYNVFILDVNHGFTCGESNLF